MLLRKIPGFLKTIAVAPAPGPKMNQKIIIPINPGLFDEFRKIPQNSANYAILRKTSHIWHIFWISAPFRPALPPPPPGGGGGEPHPPVGGMPSQREVRGGEGAQDTVGQGRSSSFLSRQGLFCVHQE